METFLACRVPDLEFYFLNFGIILTTDYTYFSLQFYSLYFEVDTNSRYECRIESIVGKSEKNASFTDSRIANK